MERIPVVDASLREEESLQEEISLPVAIAAAPGGWELHWDERRRRHFYCSPAAGGTSGLLTCGRPAGSVSVSSRLTQLWPRMQACERDSGAYMHRLLHAKMRRSIWMLPAPWRAQVRDVRDITSFLL